MPELPPLFGPDPITLADARTLAAQFKALSDPSRVQLVSLLRNGGEWSQSELIEGLGHRLTQTTAHHHLRILVDAGLVVRRTEGAWRMHCVDLGVFTATADAIRPGGSR